MQQLVKLHNAKMMYSQAEVKLVNQKPFFEQGTLTLLHQIELLGSVREACASMGISYSKGWSIIHDAEDGVGCRIVERQPGGKNGSTASVSVQGKNGWNYLKSIKAGSGGRQREYLKKFFYRAIS